MKQFLTFLAVVLLLAACNSNKDKITIKDDKGNKATIDVSDLKKAAEKIQENNDKADGLKKLTPLTLDQMKALLPEELMGMKRKSFNTSSAMGFAVGTGRYEGEDKEMKLEIMDCAGEMGANIYNLRFFSLWNYQQEDDNGYQKTIEFNGGKAIEKFSKGSNRYELTYFTGDRFIVNVEGKNTGLDAVKEIASSVTPKVN
jgi:hypothetical protein